MGGDGGVAGRAAGATGVRGATDSHLNLRASLFTARSRAVKASPSSSSENPSVRPAVDQAIESVVQEIQPGSQRPRGRRRARRFPCPDPCRSRARAGARHRPSPADEGCDAQLRRQLADRGQLVARPKRAHRDQLLDTGDDLPIEGQSQARIELQREGRALAVVVLHWCVGTPVH